MIMEKDALTGAYTFKAFLANAQALIETKNNEEFAILAIDIERFKVINDLFGMEKGDEVLIKLVEFCYERLGELSLVGRVGGDKFVCICRKSQLDISVIKNNMQTVINNNGDNYTIFFQMGIYFIEDRTLPIIKMCDRALLALNGIKNKRLENVAVFSESKRDELLMGEQLISDLDRALDNREFLVMIQPIFDIVENRVASGEVLVRWQHPKHGFLAPGRFVPIFEENNLISRVDRYVWEEAARIIRKMMDDGDVVPLSVNVSRTDLEWYDIEEVFTGLVKQYDIPAELLHIEITESTYIDNPERMVNTVKSLKKKGFVVLMDDFGTGYSSLRLLKDLSFDYLKIDKSLTDEIESSNKAGNLVSSIIKMSKWLGMSVVTEGVEKGSQAAFLKNVGCDYIQGYLYSKPIVEDEFYAVLKNSVEDYCEQETEDIDLDKIFAVDNVEVRSFISTIAGPMAIYEVSPDRFNLLKVNDEYLKLFEITPRELFGEGYSQYSEMELYSINRIKEACRRARKNHTIERLTVGKLNKKDEWMWLDIRLRYIGDRDKRQRFLLGIQDVTREYNKKNRQLTTDFYPLLCHLYGEITSMDYTENTITTLYRDSVVQRDNKKSPLDEMVKLFAKDVAADEESSRLFSERLSREYIEEFFASDKKTFTFPLRLKTSRGIINSEMTVIKDVETPGTMKVMACTRVVGE